MDKFRIRYITYDEYKTNKSSIPENAICYIEDRSIIVVKGKEYKCVGTIDLNDLDNFKADYTTANEQSGVYLVTTTYSTINCTCGILFQYNDSMGHATHQIILGNLTISDGAIVGHGDLYVTVCYRSYGYASSYLTNGKWSDWQEIRISDLINISTTITNLSNDVTKLKNTKYPVKYTGSITYSDGSLYTIINNTTWDDVDEIYCSRTAVVSPTNTTFDIYLHTNFIKAIIDKLTDNGEEYKTFKIHILHYSSKTLSVGFYISASGGVLDFTSQDNGDYVATDSTNKIYYRAINPVNNRKEILGIEMTATITIYRGTSTSSYSTVTLTID